MSEQNGASSQKEVILISIDSDDDEEEDGGVEAVNDEENHHDHHENAVNGGGNGFIRSPPYQDENSQEEEDPEEENERGVEGMMLDVDRLPVSTLRSIVSSIISSRRSSSQSSCSRECSNCEQLSNNILELKTELENSTTKISQLEEENDKLRQELGTEKEDKVKLEEKLSEMTTNLGKLQEVANAMAEVNKTSGESSSSSIFDPVSIDEQNAGESQAAAPSSEPLLPTASHPAVEALLALSSTGNHHEIDSSKPHGVFCSCGEQFRTKNCFYYHAKKMTCESFGNAQFGCPRCSKKFPVFSVLRKHMVKKHRLTYREGLVGCRYCGDVFLSRSSLLAHQRVAHKGGHHRFASWYHHSLSHRQEPETNGQACYPPQTSNGDEREQQQDSRLGYQNLTEFGINTTPTAVQNGQQHRQNEVEDAEVITIDSDDDEDDNVSLASPQSQEDLVPNRAVPYLARKFAPSGARAGFRVSGNSPQDRALVLASQPQHFRRKPVNGAAFLNGSNRGRNGDGVSDEGYFVIDHFIFTS